MILGKRIEQKFTESGMMLKTFASRINRSPKNVYSIFKQDSVDTNLLKRIGEVLNHDFFQYFVDKKASHVHDDPAHYGTTKPTPALMMNLTISLNGFEKHDMMQFVDEVQSVTDRFKKKVVAKKN